MGQLRWACTLAVLATALGVPETRLRGVDPQLIHRYQSPGADFACLDGIKTIPKDHLNDEYCDCYDGSDEPGTSACPNSSFYCRNRGHLPLRLNASMVDDQLCDCCDGSDERAGLCRNTCVEAGAAARAQLKQRAAAAAEGGEARKAYAQTWSVQEAQWRAELKRLEADIAQKQKHVSYWQGKKQAVEAEEALEREREQAARAAQEVAAAALAAASNLTGGAAAPAPAPSAGEAPQHEPVGEPAGSEGQVPEGATHADGPFEEAGAGASPSFEEPEGQSDTAPPEASVEEVDSTPADAVAASGQQQPGEHASPEAAGGEHPPGEHAEELDEESAEERGKRIAAQWTHDPEAIGEVAKEQEEEAAAEDAAAQPGAEDAEDTVPPAKLGVWGTAKGWLARGLGFAKGAALPSQQRQHVKDTFAKHQSALTELTGKKAELERKLGLDFGPAGAFAALLDRCFTANVEKYVYEVCIYQEARQKEGAASTSLGSWRGFEDDHTAAVFDGGQHCWNGPQRSMRVALQCGVEERLANVSEPNRCEYVARLFTPAACTPDHVSHAWRELEAAEQELASVHDEL